MDATLTTSQVEELLSPGEFNLTEAYISNTSINCEFPNKGARHGGKTLRFPDAFYRKEIGQVLRYGQKCPITPEATDTWFHGSQSSLEQGNFEESGGQSNKKNLSCNFLSRAFELYSLLKY